MSSAIKYLTAIGLCLLITSFQNKTETPKSMITNKMKIEIWSDVVCPWCYIGKRRLEEALEQFPNGEYLEIEWKSYQLDPEMETDTSLNIHQYLADKKGMTLDQAKAMGNHVAEVAKSVGLTYHFEKTIPVNTINAHRLIHFAHSENKQGEMKERLLKAYFMEGQNLDDFAVLTQLASEVGLDKTKTKDMLETGLYMNEVNHDIMEGRQLGLRGVPFFVFDRKYGISGAQETSVFTNTLNTAFTEWLESNPQKTLEVIDGKVCTPDGKCD